MTRFRLALLGDPVEFSKSPLIHRQMLAMSGLDGEYLTIRADHSVLTSEVDALRRGDRHGLNVTMPLKGAAAAAADRLSDEAQRAGSVNTLSRQGDQVIGHSTDAQTFASLLADPRFSSAASILLLGAGGSAAAALATGVDRPVYLAARRSAQAARVTSALGGEVIPWGAAVLGALLVNTTPLGMNGEALPREVLRAATGLIDLPYGPSPTPAVARAAEMGIPFADGFEFLVRQATASFRIWTGVEIDHQSLLLRLRNA